MAIRKTSHTCTFVSAVRAIKALRSACHYRTARQLSLGGILPIDSKRRQRILSEVTRVHCWLNGIAKQTVIGRHYYDYCNYTKIVTALRIFLFNCATFSTLFKLSVIKKSPGNEKTYPGAKVLTLSVFVSTNAAQTNITALLVLWQ